MGIENIFPYKILVFYINFKPNLDQERGSDSLNFNHWEFGRLNAPVLICVQSTL